MRRWHDGQSGLDDFRLFQGHRKYFVHICKKGVTHMDQNRKFTTRKVEPRRETMVVFDPNVSDDEFDKASQPTRQDWAAAAYALGMALTFDLPTVEALRLT